jgi:hypothetical protein
MVGGQLGPTEIVSFFEQLPLILRTRPWYFADKKAADEMVHRCKALQVQGAKAAKQVLNTV